ncbi:MAG: type II toxin-antitoxin system RelE/ParE family toxin [Gemmatimonadota bacterium]
MIRGFRDSETERVFNRRKQGLLRPDIQRRALRKLLILDAADSLNDLRVPPRNRLKKLSGDRRGQHSIRINNRWRVCFVWEEGNADEVEIVDYH